MSVNSTTDSHPEEFYEEIKKVFDDDLEQENIVDLKWVDKILSEGKEEALARLHDDWHNKFVEDTIKEMEWWASFREDSYKPVSSKFDSLFEKRSPSASNDPYIAPPKVGKNDPCLCGSGLKFKKCCGS